MGCCSDSGRAESERKGRVPGRNRICRIVFSGIFVCFPDKKRL